MGFKSRNFENDVHLHLRVPTVPVRAPPGRELRGLGGIESYTTKNHLLYCFWFSIVVNSKMIFIFIGSIGLNPPLGPLPPGGRLCGGQRVPQNEYNFKIPNIENLRINITQDFWWYGFSILGILKYNKRFLVVQDSIPPKPPQLPPWEHPQRDCGYPQMKMNIIFKIPTTENPYHQKSCVILILGFSILGILK